MRVTPPLCSLLIAVAWAEPLGGAEGSRNHGPAVTLMEPLSLRDCMLVALRENLGLRIRVMNEVGARAAEVAERGAFDPELSGGAVVRESRSAQAASELEGSSAPRSRDGNFDVRLVQPLGTGGEVALGSEASKRKSNSAFAELNPAFDAEWVASVRQPLLRGFWFDAARIALKEARIDSVTAGLEVRKTALDVARDVEVAYWDLAAATRAEVILSLALETAKRLVEETQVRLEAGLANRVNIVEAESSRAQREEEVIVARQERMDRLDELFQLLGRLGGDEPEVRIAPAPPLPGPDTRSEEEVMDLIRQELPDYQLALKEVEKLRLGVDRERSELLPDVSLAASGGYSGRDSGFPQAYRGASERDGFEWEVGLRVTMPLTFREGRARLLRAKARLGAGELARDQVDSDLRLRLRLARRGVETAAARVTAATAARVLAEERFDQLRAQFGEGLAPIRDVLLAQDDREQARLREVRARLAAAKAVAELARLDGSILTRHSIFWGPLQ
ncbi:MAG: TolC family protein [Verrucomicrobiia bacterium]